MKRQFGDAFEPVSLAAPMMPTSFQTAPTPLNFKKTRTSDYVPNRGVPVFTPEEELRRQLYVQEMRHKQETEEIKRKHNVEIEQLRSENKRLETELANMEQKYTTRLEDEKKKLREEYERKALAYIEQYKRQQAFYNDISSADFRHRPNYYVM
eukprot:GEZU01036469.1.p1 GENE.GEZU01036469.1~~GEZU01036469.1.p1  ORF type:complete len:153 (-),score=50.28 GEZU01036469.1:527-985(-)